MASLGQELKRERELKGISLKEIASSTRISLKFLQAIENDELHIIPGSFFIRAILRSYAQTAGLDEHQVLNRYEELRSFVEESPEARVEKRRDSGLSLSLWKKLTLVMGIFLLFGFLVFFIFFPFSEKKPETTLFLSPATTSTSEESAAEAPVNEPATDIQAALDLKLSFIEETWLQVFADGVLVFEGIKKQGDSLRFSGTRELGLNLGNAGGLTFFINGKRGKPFGPRGAVRKDIKITLDNRNQFLFDEEESRIPGQ